MWRALAHPRTQLQVGPVKESSVTWRSSGLKAFSVQLGIPYAFRSAQVDTWTNVFRLVAEKIGYHAPTVPYMSPLLIKIVSPDKKSRFNRAYLSRGCRATVDFSGAIEATRDDGFVNAETN